MRVSDQKLPLSNTLSRHSRSLLSGNPEGFLKGTGFRVEPVPAGSKRGTCRNDRLSRYFRVNDDQKGLTLIEVMIASVIVLILFLALMQSVLLSINMNLKNQLRDAAVNIAEERMRELRSLDFDDPILNAGTTNELPVERTFRDFTRPFAIRRTVTNLGVAPVSMKSIAVSVSYSDVKDNTTCSVTTTTACTQDSDCPAGEICGLTHTISSILRKED